MADYTELEIGLFPREGDDYSIELRFNDPHDQASHSPVRGIACFNFTELRAKRLNPDAYGKILSDSLFSDANIRSYYDQVSAVAQSTTRPLRLRLNIDVDAPGLHDLRWETLRDPKDGSWLLTNENLLFSRFLTSTNWDRVHLRPKGDLRALVMIANPQDLAEGKYQVDNQSLAPVDVKGELERAQQGLGTILQDSLISDPKKPGQASLNRLASRLREGFDILYLVCHGALLTKDPAGPYLWLEEEDGTAAVVPGVALIDRIKDLSTELRPRLIVLASCQSAGQGGTARTSDVEGALAALGPRLAQVGIPAVLTMQGDISMETVARFMPVFFQELARDGQIDRAMAVGRGVVRERLDNWMPVLFTRLKSGRIWYVPGFGDEREEFQKWQSMIGFIQEKNCTPILGPGLGEPVVGSRRDLALNWAEKHGYPLAPSDKDNLPRVAQYLITRQAPAYIPHALREAVQDEIMRRFREYLPVELQVKNAWSATELLHAIDLAAKVCWSNSQVNPYESLARLRLPIYITTSPSNLMTQALIDMGTEPIVRICPWNRWIPKEMVIYEEDPTPEKPLVYHLYGHFSVPNSIVITEDMYFDYLIGVTLNKHLIPTAVRAQLNNSSLLFLGFQLEDWEFRVFFRFLMAQEGKELLKLYSHAAAQIAPEEDRILDVKRSHAYLEEYFKSEHISIYWGSSEEFLSSLWQHLPKEFTPKSA